MVATLERNRADKLEDSARVVLGVGGPCLPAEPLQRALSHKSRVTCKTTRSFAALDSASLAVSLPKRAFVKGEAVLGEATVDNRSGVPVGPLLVHLRTTITITQGSIASTSTRIANIATCAVDVAPRSSQTVPLRFDAPRTPHSSCFDATLTCEFAFVFELLVATALPLPNLRAEVPVLLLRPSRHGLARAQSSGEGIQRAHSLGPQQRSLTRTAPLPSDSSAAPSSNRTLLKDGGAYEACIGKRMHAC